jgi:hypothetical protein
MAASHALPPLSPQPILSDVHVEGLYGAERGDNSWMPCLVNMVDRVTLPVLNPKSVSRYDRLYEVVVVTLLKHARRLQTKV